MSTLYTRPSKKGVNKRDTEWLTYGAWGKYYYKPTSSPNEFRQLLRDELIRDGILPPNAPPASIQYHQHVTAALSQCSRIGDRWVKDESFAARLKRLREEAKLTQEQLALKAGLDVGTIRQLEQGTRTNPQWSTVCSLASGLDQIVMAFIGTEAINETTQPN
jgi:DNA-binding XRE family transcriptional regulator